MGCGGSLFEEFSERLFRSALRYMTVAGLSHLNQLQPLTVHHALRQTADIVVGLDGGRRAFEGNGLDHIRVQCSLKEPLNLAGIGCVLSRLLNPDGLLLENVDEGIANELALLLGVLDALEASEELLRRIYDREVDTEMLEAAEDEVRDLGVQVSPEDVDDELPDWGPGVPQRRQAPPD